MDARYEKRPTPSDTGLEERRDPWLKFFTSDHRADPGLRMCSYAARGLWIDMLCMMHAARPYGHLLVGGTAPTPANLANLFGGSSSQVRKLMDELEKNGVFSRTADGVIYSRRMLRDARRRETNRNNGGKGGNPRLLDNRNVAASDNPPDIPEQEGSDNPSVPPEARDQRPEAKDKNPESSATPQQQQHAAAALLGDGAKEVLCLYSKYEAEVFGTAVRQEFDEADWQAAAEVAAYQLDPHYELRPVFLRTLQKKRERDGRAPVFFRYTKEAIDDHVAESNRIKSQPLIAR